MQDVQLRLDSSGRWLHLTAKQRNELAREFPSDWPRQHRLAVIDRLEAWHTHPFERTYSAPRSIIASDAKVIESRARDLLLAMSRASEDCRREITASVGALSRARPLPETDLFEAIPSLGADLPPGNNPFAEQMRSIIGLIADAAMVTSAVMSDRDSNRRVARDRAQALVRRVVDSFVFATGALPPKSPWFVKLARAYWHLQRNLDVDLQIGALLVSKEIDEAREVLGRTGRTPVRLSTYLKRTDL